MRIIFAGTPDFAAETLTALLTTQHEVCAVYTQPDRPAGRGRKLTASPVKQVALDHHIPVEQPLNFKTPESLEALANYQADLMIVVAYGLLLPQVVLDTPTYGCINIHASLLPRWRGAAPIQRAILAGDEETGVCIMQMEAGLDTGPVLAQASCPILEADTASTLHDRLAQLGADTLLNVLNNVPALQKQAKQQDHDLTCYAEKLSKQEAELDWSCPAKVLLRKIHAFNPWPIAQTHWKDNVMRLWNAEVMTEQHETQPGTIVGVSKQGIDVSTGEGTLRITQLQMPGKKAMPVSDFLNAQQIAIGETLG